MYKFNKIATDTFELTIGEEKKVIHRDQESIADMQMVDVEAKILYASKLKDMGYDMDNDPLVTSIKKGNEIIINDSERTKALEDCKQIAMIKKLDKILKKQTGKGFIEYTNILGDKINEFIIDIVSILSNGDLPSKEQTNEIMKETEKKIIK